MNIRYLILFFVLNFGGLALGGLATNSGVTGSWYQQLSKAPWTPPGWVFGTAWFLIMVCFSFFMANSLSKFPDSNKMIIGLFCAQWVLNVAWNFIFFKAHQTGIALADISLLFILIAAMIVIARQSQSTVQVILLLPYIIWLTIAVSLNLYVVMKN